MPRIDELRRNLQAAERALREAEERLRVLREDAITAAHERQRTVNWLVAARTDEEREAAREQLEHHDSTVRDALDVLEAALADVGNAGDVGTTVPDPVPTPPTPPAAPAPAPAPAPTPTPAPRGDRP